MFHVVWVLCWFIATVEWAVAPNILGGILESIVRDQLNENCTISNETAEIGNTGYVQAAIGDVSKIVENVILCTHQYSKSNFIE